MKKIITLFMFLLAIVRSEKVTFDDDDAMLDDKEQSKYVTCGSVIKLEHLQTKHRLHSHEVTYGSGSGQQSVTGFPEFDDPNSLWQITKYPIGSCKQGTPIKSGSVVRLMHQATHRNLHSHMVPSPLSNNQEVSCFGDQGVGDAGDKWVLETASGKGLWKRGDTVYFKHKDTGKYLSASGKHKFGNPIPGQLEVSAIGSRGQSTKWSANEGYYFPKRK